MLGADQFLEDLRARGGPVDQERNRRQFRTGNTFLGVRMGQVFKLAKEYIDMPLDEIDKLLRGSIHEARVGALSIMGHKAMRKRTSAEERKGLYELFMRRVDEINTWDLVDLCAHKVVGGYLLDKPRDVLYRMARSPDWWQRRIAIYSTLWFVRAGELDDTFAIAEILVDDDHDLIHKVVGGMVREAGKKDRPRMLEFLDRHAATMPRVALRYAIEHLDPDSRKHYLAARSLARS